MDVMHILWEKKKWVVTSLLEYACPWVMDLIDLLRMYCIFCERCVIVAAKKWQWCCQ